MALQELALYLKNKYGDVGHANAYLRYAIEDAIFFNSRLRMDGVAAKFPQIVVDYQDKVKDAKKPPDAICHMALGARRGHHHHAAHHDLAIPVAEAKP